MPLSPSSTSTPRSVTDPARWRHDCDRCIFLGQHTNKLGSSFDLYYCPGIKGSAILLGSVLARYANEPSHYLSYDLGIIIGMRLDEGSVMIEASRRAIRMLLDCYDALKEADRVAHS